MAIPSINGKFWVKTNGTRRVENAVRVRRAGRVLKLLQYMHVNYRTCQSHTDASDSDARDPDAGELWFDPINGKPDNAEDWLVGSAKVVFDVESGAAVMTVSSVQIPADWEGVAHMGSDV